MEKWTRAAAETTHKGLLKFSSFSSFLGNEEEDLIFMPSENECVSRTILDKKKSHDHIR